MSQAVTQNAIADTTSVMTRRLTSAHLPPRHSHRTRSCVEYRDVRFMGTLSGGGARTDRCSRSPRGVEPAAGGRQRSPAVIQQKGMSPGIVRNG